MRYQCDRLIRPLLCSLFESSSYSILYGIFWGWFCLPQPRMTFINMFRVLGSGLRTMTWIFLEKNRYLSTLAVASSQSPADRYGWLALVRRKFYSIYSFLLFCLGDRQPVCVSPFAFYHNLVLILNKAEHHVIYQYRLVNAANHYMGLIQTESVSPNSFLRIYNQPILTWMILALFPTQTCASGAFQSRTDLQWSLSLSKKSIGVGAKHHKLQ